MPNYSTTWQRVWGPYQTYGRSPEASEGIRGIVDKIERTSLRNDLIELVPHFEAIENYRSACRELRAQPENQALKLNKNRLYAELLRNTNTFHQRLLSCVNDCEVVVTIFTEAAAVLKDDPRHVPLVRDILVTLKQMSTDLLADSERYGLGMEETLEAISKQ